MPSSSIVSTQNRVEAPFIIATIGGYTFGHCSDMSMRNSMNVTFPNFMDSINIVKVNGAVNTYSLKMIYGITENDDPNLLEKVFSSVSTSRSIKLSYGDCSTPNYIYKDEEAIITKIQSQVDFNQSRITYNISCVSTSLALQAGSFDFPARENTKPSDVLKEILNNEAYGLKKIFSGMRNPTKVGMSGLLASNDKPVDIVAKPSTNVFDYIGFLVNNMTSQSDAGGPLKDSNYFWAVYDDVNNEFGGPYFKIQEVSPGSPMEMSYNTYEVDVGYPSGNYVTSFQICTDNVWSILYDSAASIDMPQTSYAIDRSGEVVSVDSPSFSRSPKYLKTTEPDKSWWSKMTNFPITARITIKGLLRPSILMSYLKVNAYFYGKKHISSGLYIITRQEDVISSSGYRTTLSLTRIKGD